MPTFVVVNNPKNWPLDIPGIELVSARSYLTDPRYIEFRGAKIFNLCRSYRYQSLGYYVSLLAEARGHKPMPSVNTIQDLKSQTLVRIVSEELDELIQSNLASIQSDRFVLSIYFGRNLARKYDRLSWQLFNLYPSPMLRADFTRNSRWQLQNINPVSAAEVPEEHRPFVVEVAREYFGGRRPGRPRPLARRYDLAILYNPAEESPPSDPRALRRFIRAAEALDMGVKLIDKEDYGRVAEFDALFIRETTAVNHHTYRFARRALAEGLVVVDDPESIVKCTNKVYLAELLAKRRVPSPRTLILHRDGVAAVAAELGFPCILKQPDSSFSQGVVKIDDEAALRETTGRLFEKSDLLIAQEFLPTDFDWRIGIFDRQPLYACKYYMARKHWQIIRWQGNERERYGKVETFAVEEAPPWVVRTALRAAALIGDGLYGVDLKQVGRKCCVIEVNDNPSIDAGAEDAVLKDALYTRIMEVFLRRIERLKAAGRRR